MRLLRISAAAAAATTITTAPIARYVAVGDALVGGTTGSLGEGATVGVSVSGTAVTIGDGVGTIAGDEADVVFSLATNAVSAVEP